MYSLRRRCYLFSILTLFIFLFCFWTHGNEKEFKRTFVVRKRTPVMSWGDYSLPKLESHPPPQKKIANISIATLCKYGKLFCFHKIFMARTFTANGIFSTTNFSYRHSIKYFILSFSGAYGRKVKIVRIRLIGTGIIFIIRRYRI